MHSLHPLSIRKNSEADVRVCICEHSSNRSFMRSAHPGVRIKPSCSYAFVFLAIAKHRGVADASLRPLSGPSHP